MDNKLINVIDFGSSKIRFSIFDSNLKNKFSDSVAVNLDENFSNHFIKTGELIKKAEKKISTHIEDVILIYDTSNIYIIDISLNKTLDSNFELKNIYNSLILELTQIINSNYNNHEVKHIIINKCIINGKIYDNIPKELKNVQNIKVHFTTICLPKKLNKKIINKFKKLSLNVEKIFCTSYTKSLFYSQKINNKSLYFLDIGLERTSIIIYKNKKLNYMYSIPIGGSHITKDISKIFKISIDEAEEIKRLFNKSETEFSYKNYENQKFTPEIIIKKNISIDILKKVILYRIQEIIDLIFKNLNNNPDILVSKQIELLLIGEGSKLFNDNSFQLNDKFDFKSIKVYEEKDSEICTSGLIYFLNNYETPKLRSKTQGFFEKFFNFFSK